MWRRQADQARPRQLKLTCAIDAAESKEDFESGRCRDRESLTRRCRSTVMVLRDISVLSIDRIPIPELHNTACGLNRIELFTPLPTTRVQAGSFNIVDFVRRE